MTLLKKLFRCKDSKCETPVELPVAKPVSYTIGWSIYTTTDIQTRTYDNVPESSRVEIGEFIEQETQEMHDALNKAVKEGTEFVNLQGNVLRVKDVIKICITNSTNKN